MIKTCTTCKQTKPLDEFTRCRSRRDGYEYTCKLCSRQKSWLRYDGVNALLKNAQSRARKKDIEFDLDREFLYSLRDLQQNLCALSGVPLNWDYTSRRGTQRLCPEDRVSIDRIDSSGGYTKENIQLVTDSANKLKGTLSMSGVYSLCEQILRHGKQYRP